MNTDDQKHFNDLWADHWLVLTSKLFDKNLMERNSLVASHHYSALMLCLNLGKFSFFRQFWPSSRQILTVHTGMLPANRLLKLRTCFETMVKDKKFSKKFHGRALKELESFLFESRQIQYRKIPPENLPHGSFHYR